MTVLPILVYGDSRLEAANQPVRVFGEELRSLVGDLFETGWNAPGLGLAAPQVGVNLRIATIDTSVGKDPAARMVIANPEIVSSRGEARLEEGCLSFPGLYTTIQRPTTLHIRAQDESGRWCELDTEGLLAQAICHEVDHLNGVLLIHHLRGMKRRLFLRRVAKMRKLGVWAATA